MEERIIAIQNLSITPITIEGVLLNQNAISYPTIGFWLTPDWKPLTLSTTLKVFLSTGIGYTLTLNPDEYANAFSRTANFVETNYLMLIELEKLQGQLITTDNVPTNITEFSLTNGVHNIQWYTTAIDSATGNALGENNYAVIKVVGNVHTLVGTLTQDRKTNLLGTVRTSISTTTNSVRIRATGATGVTLLWNIKIINK